MRAHLLGPRGGKKTNTCYPMGCQGPNEPHPHTVLNGKQGTLLSLLPDDRREASSQAPQSVPEMLALGPGLILIGLLAKDSLKVACMGIQRNFLPQSATATTQRLEVIPLSICSPLALRDGEGEGAEKNASDFPVTLLTKMGLYLSLTALM